MQGPQPLPVLAGDMDANAALAAPVVVQFKCKPMLTTGTMTATTTNSEALDALGRASICAFHSPSSILFKSYTFIYCTLPFVVHSIS